MTEEFIGRRMGDALHAFEVPAYPSEAVAARTATPRDLRVRARSRALIGVFAALVLAVVAAGSAAFAVPAALPNSVLRLFDNFGVHLPGRPMLALQSRTVSLAEARAQSDFPILVPLGVRVERVRLSTDRRHKTFASLVLQDGHGSQIELEETRADHRLTDAKHQPSFQIASSGRSAPPPNSSWVAVENSRLQPAPGTSSAPVVGAIIIAGRGSHLMTKPRSTSPKPWGATDPRFTFYAITKTTPIRWTLGATNLLMTPYDAPSRAFAERVRRLSFSSR